LAHRSTNPEDPGTLEVQDGNGKPRRNKNKHRHNGAEADDTAVNAGFHNSKFGPWKKPSKGNQDGPIKLDAILDRLCQIDGTSDKPANHTNRKCWVIKQAGKLTGEDTGKSPVTPWFLAVSFSFRFIWFLLYFSFWSSSVDLKPGRSSFLLLSSGSSLSTLSQDHFPF
jgi:hypothetical protein